MTTQLVFDDEAAQRIEAIYHIGDAVRRRRIVRAALEKRISRASDASSPGKAAYAGSSQLAARWETLDGEKTRSSGPSPTTW